MEGKSDCVEGDGGEVLGGADCDGDDGGGGGGGGCGGGGSGSGGRWKVERVRERAAGEARRGSCSAWTCALLHGRPGDSLSARRERLSYRNTSDESAEISGIHGDRFESRQYDFRLPSSSVGSASTRIVPVQCGGSKSIGGWLHISGDAGRSRVEGKARSDVIGRNEVKPMLKSRPLLDYSEIRSIEDAGSLWRRPGPVGAYLPIQGTIVHQVRANTSFSDGLLYLRRICSRMDELVLTSRAKDYEGSPRLEFNRQRDHRSPLFPPLGATVHGPLYVEALAALYIIERRPSLGFSPALVLQTVLGSLLGLHPSDFATVTGKTEGHWFSGPVRLGAPALGRPAGDVSVPADQALGWE
ncbi:hypothetical protein KM043_013534 [Ampulex compressa]|nr:hypothetical protein KM043_013534 [Ampulex compressa]